METPGARKLTVSIGGFGFGSGKNMSRSQAVTDENTRNNTDAAARQAFLVSNVAYNTGFSLRLVRFQ